MKPPKTVKGFLQMCLAISRTDRDDLKGIDKLSEDEYLFLGNIRAGIQNELGEDEFGLMKKLGLNWPG